MARRRTSRALPILPFAGGDATGPSIEVHRLDAAHPLFHQHAHGHRFFEMIYVARGRGTHRLGARRIAVQPGDLFVVAPGEAHDARSMQVTDAWLVLFTGDALQAGHSEADAFVALPGELLLLSFLRPRGAAAGHLRVRAEDRAGFVDLLTGLQRELASRELGFAEAARARLTLVLVEAARLAAPLLGRVTVAHRPLVADVLRFVEARYMRPISLVDVARAVGKSPAYLTDVVRRETGRSVLAWVIERRMADARQRLIETEASIAEIAEALGYSDESWFARQFKKAHRVTPTQFRARHR
jgi:AraC-like DNA-binding protein